MTCPDYSPAKSFITGWLTIHRETYHEVMCLWKEESGLAKQEQRQVGWAKPKLGKLEPWASKQGSEKGSKGGKGGEPVGGGGKGNGEVTANKDE
ncbi:hypothetical protein PAXINDRAFT_84600 [Paxillus involutus ATCC 200175]|uniref:Uncharacterized protein n=1 Tax=Paxillus involutus ATCC 200175 TaxID=664439 RepID=A0A0C9TVQ6_PAXIN|nr:hypothetical protein PAXINDRAFT_84600 [Paxillus involutus ATCC 200175]